MAISYEKNSVMIQSVRHSGGILQILAKKFEALRNSFESSGLNLYFALAKKVLLDR